MKKYITILFFMICSASSFSQVEFGSILEGTLGDAQILLKGYVRPIAEGFGYSVNGGWFTTAKTHKLFGFDFAIVTSAAIAPSSAETFTFNNSDYSPNLQLDNSNISSAELPTFFGSQELEDRPLLAFTDNDGNSVSTSALPGSGLGHAIGFNAVPSAVIQVGVGLFKNTDLKIRFVPKQAASEYEFSSFGFGIQHDLKQWIPFVKRLPFDVSALVAWNDVKSKAFLDAEDNPTQALEFTTNTFLFQILASKKLSIFTLYGGVGASSYTSDVNLLGNYSNVSMPDPISLNYKGGSMRANLGLTMKILLFNLSADYAVQEYDTFSVTAGFSFR
jgi:hypothetical protein|tara:strand:- start:2428 stop:3423 length:996 start_codon:yes stop_codon:yes gene_type:complete